MAGIQLEKGAVVSRKPLVDTRETSPAAPMASTATFRFLDLPPELRDMIYELALVHYRPIAPYPPHIRMGLLDETSYYDNPRDVTALNLLGVNRQITAEATPVAYGRNCFSGVGGGHHGRLAPIGFEEKTLLRWLKLIGSCRKHVRSIRISEVASQQVMRSALHLLKDAQHLTSISLNSDLPHSFDRESSRNRYKIAAKDVLVFLPLLKSLRELRVARMEGTDVVNVLQHHRWQDDLNWADEYERAAFEKDDQIDLRFVAELRQRTARAREVFAGMQRELREKLE